MPRKAAPEISGHWHVNERTPKGREKNWINTDTGEVISNRQYREYVKGPLAESGLTIEEYKERNRIENTGRKGPLIESGETLGVKHPEWLNVDFDIKVRSNQIHATTLDSLPFVQAFIDRTLGSNSRVLVWVVAQGMVREYPRLDVPNDAPEDEEDRENETGVPGTRTIISPTAARDLPRRWNTKDHELSQFTRIERVTIRIRQDI